MEAGTDPVAWAPERRPSSRRAVFLFGRRVTPWRRNPAEAIEDAIAEGHATRDDAPRAPVYWFVGADLVEQFDRCPAPGPSPAARPTGPSAGGHSFSRPPPLWPAPPRTSRPSGPVSPVTPRRQSPSN